MRKSRSLLLLLVPLVIGLLIGLAESARGDVQVPLTRRYVEAVAKTVMERAPIGGSTLGDKRKIEAVIDDEIAKIEVQVTLPDFTYSVVAPYEYDGFTAITAQPVRYSMVIMRWKLWRESAVRFVVGHEIGHMVLSEMDRPQSEAAADAFSDCYSSVGNHETGCAAWRKYLEDTARK